MKPLREVLVGPFAEWLGDNEWTPWFAFLFALRGEWLNRTERKIFRQCTGRHQLPDKPFSEAWVIVGRRGRKSAIAAALGVYHAVYGAWPRAAGETVRVLIVAVSKDQARIVRDYAQAILESRPGLKRLIVATDAESITLSNGITIQTVANSFRSIRGPTVVCCILEEVAFWRDENSANPDKEILRAVRPSMLTVPGALVLGISSPYSQSGLLFEKYRAHYGRDESKVLIWKASTETMNPLVDPEAIAEAYADDPIAAAAEYGAEFRTDISTFIEREVVERCIDLGVRERARKAGTTYKGFVDPSGGSRDSMTLAISHREKDTIILDAIRERKPPFSPEDVVAEFSLLLKSYGVTAITGDKYAGEWPRERFRAHGITYEASAKPKSDLYLGLLPVLNSGNVRFLDQERLLNQLISLERRTARGGRDSIDHAPNAHDDVANAVAGAVSSFAGRKYAYDDTLSWVGDDQPFDLRALNFQRHIFGGGMR